MDKTLEAQLDQMLADSKLQTFTESSLGTTDDVRALRAMVDGLVAKIQEMEGQLTYPVVLYDLDESHLLNQPILVSLRELGETALATWSELNLYAEGETPGDALAALKQEIVRLYDDLILTPSGNLGPLPQRWLRTLTKVIQANA